MAGRPKKEFTKEHEGIIFRLAESGCPDSSIGLALEVDEATIKRHFAPLLKKARESGKNSIRAKQYELAMEGNTALLIWLGKQWLGQREKHEIDFTQISDEELLEVVKARLVTQPKLLNPGKE